MSIKSLVKKALIAVENRKYQKALEARRMSYAQWQEMQTDAPESASFSLDNYVVLQSCQGIPAKGWQEMLSTHLAQQKSTLVAYGDEDVEVSPGVYDRPYFKPCWSPDLLEQWFYMGGLVAVHRTVAEKITDCPRVGTAVLEPERIQRLIEEAVQLVGGYEKDSRDVISHVPSVLFHRSKPWQEALPGTVDETVKRVDAKHLLSIVIPSKDHPGLLDTCLGAIERLERQLAYEIIVVDNGSGEENRQRCQDIFAQYRNKGMSITYLYEPMEFDFSGMCNLGAGKAAGDLLLFLNDDVELACENTLTAMALRALRPYTGAVGLKLYYPGGKRMQHCGITNLPMGPVHKLQFLEDDRDYYMGSNRWNRNVLAVTAACLMVTSDKFWQAGGFPEELKVAFNDVSLCFRLYELGYSNLIWNRHYGYHHESLSRGADEEDHKLRRLLQERKKLYQRHPRLEGKDPYYPEQLGRDGLDTRIRPAYETGGNRPQPVVLDSLTEDLGAYRRDDCLMLRVEMSTSKELLGYGVVLGDDNACYEKKLLLVKTEGEEESLSYVVTVEAQYRPDLVENLPDQRNVGMCGFWLQAAGALEKGTYGIGMLARNRVTGTKLIQFTNRKWEIDS
ncbi:MAG: glycosyltransferase [Lachnospiraceae bacterium]|nr:glycosyltransferase [Lachnospiraceae bacterium]